ncbi:hypothetical protein PV11_05760 [Exophiala sideris]|uniref:Mediator of RNA polymerase II transcription subunit 21 n=1 Tax=Exophiala sideris TaxID=1016849 RepID=A0A0D1W500_9EURO|nr:hypothetical protein PV11_05760 [Exophiala sideris]
MSNDILTQLQTCYDQLLTQFFSTISYLSQRHPLIGPDPDPNDPYTNPPAAPTQTPNPDGSIPTTSGTIPGPEDSDRAPYPLRPAAPQVFANAQRELAEDLVQKAQQIEFLISKLPGIDRGEEQQAEEIKILVQKVRDMEERRKAKRKEMRECVKRLDRVVLGMAQSIEYTAANGHQQSNGT